MALELKEHEEAFELHPVGIRYHCEVCEDGEMLPDYTQQPLPTNPPLLPHKCNKCGQTLHLPKQYPYVEWLQKDEWEKFQNSKASENNGDEVK